MIGGGKDRWRRERPLTSGKDPAAASSRGPPTRRCGSRRAVELGNGRSAVGNCSADGGSIPPSSTPPALLQNKKQLQPSLRFRIFGPLGGSRLTAARSIRRRPRRRLRRRRPRRLRPRPRRSRRPLRRSRRPPPRSRRPPRRSTRPRPPDDRPKVHGRQHGRQHGRRPLRCRPSAYGSGGAPAMGRVPVAGPVVERFATSQPGTSGSVPRRPLRLPLSPGGRRWHQSTPSSRWSPATSILCRTLGETPLTRNGTPAALAAERASRSPARPDESMNPTAPASTAIDRG
jgi:hypothetical protein